MVFKSSSTVTSVVWSVLFVCSVFSTAGIAQPCERFEIQKLTASDGEPGDFFGVGLAISGNLAVVGAYQDQEDGIRSGSAYVFAYNGTEWTQQAKLIPESVSDEALFGRSIAVQDDLMAIGAPTHIENGIGSGAVFVYRKIEGEWIEEAKILPSVPVEEGQFGVPVLFHHDKLLIGMSWDNSNGSRSGSVYVFEHDGIQWVELGKILASEGQENDGFGAAIAVSENTLVIGSLKLFASPWEEEKAVYIFRFDGSEYIEEASLGLKFGQPDGGFGLPVALHGTNLFVSDPRESTMAFERGGVHHYQYDGMDWVHQSQLVASDGESFDLFGEGLALSGSTVVIGAHFDDTLGITNTGSAYAFHFNGEQWVEHAKFLASDSACEDYLGWEIVSEGDTALVSAFYSDPNGENSGAVYVFDASPCTADLTGDCTLNIFDLLAFLDAFNAQSIIADFTGDGFFDINDILAFLDSFNAGCP